MPGRSPYQAAEAFLDPLRRALGCVAHTRVLVSAKGREVPGRQHFWTLPGDGYVDLRGPLKLQLRPRMRYMIITDDRKDFGPYRVTTRGYLYSLRRADGQSVVEYHWHPSGNSHEKSPHLHIGTAQLGQDSVISQRHHLTTGRVTFEEIIRMAIKEFGVEPLNERWNDVLDLCEAPHKLYRSWPTAAQPAAPSFD